MVTFLIMTNTLLSRHLSQLEHYFSHDALNVVCVNWSMFQVINVCIRIEPFDRVLLGQWFKNVLNYITFYYYVYGTCKHSNLENI